eukprot:GHVH01011149.1.p1 GENE.GHVH01011149.1~~GHVH01011149.1.p1  ORF type:complete len:687 (+),score=87.63 GHVH01011149.1:101-2161(+)
MNSNNETGRETSDPIISPQGIHLYNSPTEDESRTVEEEPEIRAYNCHHHSKEARRRERRARKSINPLSALDGESSLIPVFEITRSEESENPCTAELKDKSKLRSDSQNGGVCRDEVQYLNNRLMELDVERKRIDHTFEEAMSKGLRIEGAIKSYNEGRRGSEATCDMQEWTVQEGQQSVSCYACCCTDQNRSLGRIEVSGNIFHFYVDRRENPKFVNDLHLPLGCIEATAVFSTPLIPIVAKSFLFGEDYKKTATGDSVVTLVQILVKREYACVIKNNSDVSQRSPRRSNRSSLCDYKDPLMRSILFQLNIDVKDTNDEAAVRRDHAASFCRFMNQSMEEGPILKLSDASKIAHIPAFSGLLIDTILKDTSSSTLDFGYSEDETRISTPPSKSIFHNINRILFGSSSQKDESSGGKERGNRPNAHSSSCSDSQQLCKVPYGADALLVQESMEFSMLSSDDDTVDLPEMIELDDHNSVEPDAECLPGFEFSTPSTDYAKFVTSFHIAQLSYVIPAMLSRWKLAFCMRRDGISFQTLYSKLRSFDRFLMIIEDEHNLVFGAFLPCEISPRSGYYGSRESFVFTYKDNKQPPSRFIESITQSLSLEQSAFLTQPGSIQVYPWSARNSLVIYSDYESIALGGATGQSDFAITLDKDLKRGSSNTCETFNCGVLSTASDFIVHNLQFWACD